MFVEGHRVLEAWRVICTIIGPPGEVGLNYFHMRKLKLTEIKELDSIHTASELCLNSNYVFIYSYHRPFYEIHRSFCIPSLYLVQCLALSKWSKDVWWPW